MKLTINGEASDIILEDERSLGDVLSGLEAWLEKGGHRISAVMVDGGIIPADRLEAAFSRDIGSVNELDIRTSNWIELAEKALAETLSFMEKYKTASSLERSEAMDAWAGGAAASFLANRFADVHGALVRSFQKVSEPLESIEIIINDRLRELKTPQAELQRVEPELMEIVLKLENLPLDLQTGKDQLAAETIRIFSDMVEKIIRLIPILQQHGLNFEGTEVGGIPFKSFMEELMAALKELSAAYGTKDAVLVGDLAEYELAPRLRALHESLSRIVSQAD